MDLWEMSDLFGGHRYWSSCNLNQLIYRSRGRNITRSSLHDSCNESWYSCRTASCRNLLVDTDQGILGSQQMTNKSGALRTLYQVFNLSLVFELVAELLYCVSWQHTAKVNDTVEKAPRCRRLESCSNVKSPICSKRSTDNKGAPLERFFLTFVAIDRSKLLRILARDLADGKRGKAGSLR